MNGQYFYVVVEGELPHYYYSYSIHAVFTDRAMADQYAADLVRLNESQRWDNVAILTFEPNRPGHLDMVTAPLETTV